MCERRRAPVSVNDVDVNAVESNLAVQLLGALLAVGDGGRRWVSGPVLL